MGIFRATTTCKFCRRAHRPSTLCKDVNGCYCRGCSKPGHMRHPQAPKYLICGDGACPCIYKAPGPVPAAALAEVAR